MDIHSRDKKLLILDGIVNLFLGVFLLCFPLGVAAWLGVPQSTTNFYPIILGAVLCGIGAALLLEAYGETMRIRGLGLEGAIAINFCGAGALSIWLLAVTMEIPLRGYVILWVIAISVMLIGIVELIDQIRRR